MRVPLSWLRDFVAISDTPEALASRLTFGGMEVEDLEYVGLAPADRPIAGLTRREPSGAPAKGIAWDPATIVIARVLEVMPHPNADRLTLLRVDDGTGAEQIVLTGAPNLFACKGTGPLATPLKVVYAREGAVLYDGHKPGRELMTLKRAKIRGVESRSMVCSEKELGISDDHDGIIILDEDAPVGMPAADYMGDVVFEVKINPNMARNACIHGIAREIAALTGVSLHPIDDKVLAAGPSITGRLSIDIRDASLNPRFVAGLIEGVTIAPSPYLVQRRLRLAGTRPINNIVDATNYVMFEIGEPLHAFDWSVLQRRAAGGGPKIMTRVATPGETLKTLDGVDRKLDDFTVLVCDQSGALSIAGVMGGAESEVSDRTTDVLLEGAAWDFINVRRTVKAQNLPSEASYRFSRGVHPALAERGVRRGLELMRRWSGGTVAQDVVDQYPGRPASVVVEVTPALVERQLGLRLGAAEIVRILRALDFECEIIGAPDAPDTTIRAKAPDHRLDIGTGVVGQADLVEEIARIHGYDRIPETQLSELLPPPHAHPALDLEEQVRDLLVSLGLQEIVTYSLTSPEREAKFRGTSATDASEAEPYVRLANPIVVDRVVMRRDVMPGVLEVAASNARHTDRLAIFEIGAVYLARPGQPLPDERMRVALLLAGPRELQGWQGADRTPVDFFDLKGIIESLAGALHIDAVTVRPAVHQSCTPGRTAELCVEGEATGWMGDIHPDVARRFGLDAGTVVAAELDLAKLLAPVKLRHSVRLVPAYPPIKEDIAVVVDEGTPAAQVRQAIVEGGGALLAAVTLFDVFRGDQIGAGKKSLAFGLTYQAPDRTLTDAEGAKVRARIVKTLQDTLGAVLRG